MSASSFVIEPNVSALAAALAVGVVIGLERGWRDRHRQEGSRVAGLRTFALLGLLGGVLGVLSGFLGVLPVVAGFIGLSVLATVSYREGVRAHGSLSATSAVAALLTYALGALAGAGHAALAIGAAVVAAVLLNLKPTLHRWLLLVEYRELSAALQLLVLSAVILPLLPNAAFGPYGALNPYLLWWAVVLVAGLSLGGH
ncbi:MAG: MgtC/SapB family protein, partial [Aeromonas sp.]